MKSPLTIDIGTTNIKLSIFNENALVLTKTIPVKTFREDRGKVYQQPEKIWLAIETGIKQLRRDNYSIDSIHLSTAMHSIMPVFEERLGEELFIWQDYQSSAFVRQFKQTEMAKNYYQKTGTPIHEMSPFSKIASFRKKVWFNDVQQWIGIKEYIMEKLTGKCVVDYSIASATGLFNIHDKKWDEEILTFLRIKDSQLSELVDTNYHTNILPQLASQLDVKAECQVYVGASDGCLASLASYVANGTTTTLSIGTSGAVRKLSRQIELDEKGQTFCYYLNDRYWVIGVTTNNGGQVINWLHQTLFEKSSFTSFIPHVLNGSSIGSQGVTFFPYITGERAPLWQSDATGEFKGLKITHNKKDLGRSVLEGMLFNIRFISEFLNVTQPMISVNGGFFAHDLLTMLTADILHKHCVQSDNGEPTFGLLCLAQGDKVTHEGHQKRTFFNDETAKTYDRLFETFKKELKKTYEL